MLFTEKLGTNVLEILKKWKKKWFLINDELKSQNVNLECRKKNLKNNVIIIKKFKKKNWQRIFSVKWSQNYDIIYNSYFGNCKDTKKNPKSTQISW